MARARTKSPYVPPCDDMLSRVFMRLVSTVLSSRGFSREAPVHLQKLTPVSEIQVTEFKSQNALRVSCKKDVACQAPCLRGPAALARSDAKDQHEKSGHHESRSTRRCLSDLPPGDWTRVPPRSRGAPTKTPRNPPPPPPTPQLTVPGVLRGAHVQPGSLSMWYGLCSTGPS